MLQKGQTDGALAAIVPGVGFGLVAGTVIAVLVMFFRCKMINKAEKQPVDPESVRRKRTVSSQMVCCLILLLFFAMFGTLWSCWVQSVPFALIFTLSLTEPISLSLVRRRTDILALALRLRGAVCFTYLFLLQLSNVQDFYRRANTLFHAPYLTHPTHSLTHSLTHSRYEVCCVLTPLAAPVRFTDGNALARHCAR